MYFVSVECGLQAHALSLARTPLTHRSVRTSVEHLKTISAPDACACACGLQPRALPLPGPPGPFAAAAVAANDAERASARVLPGCMQRGRVTAVWGTFSCMLSCSKPCKAQGHVGTMGLMCWHVHMMASAGV